VFELCLPLVHSKLLSGQIRGIPSVSVQAAGPSLSARSRGSGSWEDVAKAYIAAVTKPSPSTLPKRVPSLQDGRQVSESSLRPTGHDEGDEKRKQCRHAGAASMRWMHPFARLRQKIRLSLRRQIWSSLYCLLLTFSGRPSNMPQDIRTEAEAANSGARRNRKLLFVPGHERLAPHRR
jgi:hypothetical protein